MFVDEQQNMHGFASVSGMYQSARMTATCTRIIQMQTHSPALPVSFGPQAS